MENDFCVKVRDAELSDCDAFLKIYSYYVKNTAITFEYEVPSLAEFESRMINTTRKYPYLAVEKNGKVVGYAYAGQFSARAAYDWACALSVYIDKDNLKCGFGRLIYEELQKRLENMGVKNLYACIGYPLVSDKYLTDNSALFHERLGFVKVGEFHKCGYKFGNWYDMIWMEKIVGQHDKNALPVAFTERSL